MVSLGFVSVHRDGIESLEFDSLQSDGIESLEFDSAHSDGIESLEFDSVHSDGISCRQGPKESRLSFDGLCGGILGGSTLELSSLDGFLLL